MNVAFALSATLFAALFLAAVMYFGGPIARDAAIAAAFVACVSQFSGQDPEAYKISIYSAYFSFIIGIFAYLALVTGH